MDDSVEDKVIQFPLDEERIVFLGTGINDQVANAIIAQLLFLDREDPERDINLYIICYNGGWLTAGTIPNEAMDQSN